MKSPFVWGWGYFLLYFVMRFLSKLEHWFKANRSQDETDYRQGDLFSHAEVTAGFLDERLPQTTPRIFQAIMNQAIAETAHGDVARLWTLDQCLHLLVVCNPPGNQKKNAPWPLKSIRRSSPCVTSKTNFFLLHGLRLDNLAPPLTKVMKTGLRNPRPLKAISGWSSLWILKRSPWVLPINVTGWD